MGHERGRYTMPCEVWWDSFADALEISSQSLFSNILIKQNSEYYLQQLKPISVGLE